jgi:hypothetical protein
VRPGRSYGGSVVGGLFLVVAVGLQSGQSLLVAEAQCGGVEYFVWAGSYNFSQLPSLFWVLRYDLVQALLHSARHTFDELR